MCTGHISTCTVQYHENIQMISHIIELLGFTSDTSHSDSLTRKRLQHNHLASHLISAGWKLATLLPPPTFPETPPVTAIALSPLTQNNLQPDPDPHLPAQHPYNIPDFSRHIHILLLSSSGVVYKVQTH